MDGTGISEMTVFRDFFMANPTGLFVYDEEGKLVDVNPVACEMHQRTREEMLSLDPREFIHPDSYHVFTDFLASVVSGKPFKGEARGLRKDGSLFEAEVSGTLVESGGRRYFFSSHVDISEQKWLRYTNQDLTERNERLKRFAYTLTHDLNDGVRYISGSAELLALHLREMPGFEFDEKTSNFLEWLGTGARRLTAIVNAVSVLYQLERHKLKMKPISIEGLVRAAWKDASKECPAARLELGKLPCVLGDEVLIHRVFANLFGNAIKFRREDLRVSVSTKKEGERWVIAVQDNGLGIPKRSVERVFMMFERAHDEEESAGAGIGLSICMDIIERHGGKIWLTSKQGEGSCFYFSLTGCPEEDCCSL